MGNECFEDEIGGGVAVSNKKLSEECNAEFD